MMNMLPELVNEAVKSPSVLLEIYKDLAKPGVKQAGVALETIIGLGNTLLWPLTVLNGKASIALKNNLEKYRIQLEKIPQEKIVNVAPEIGVPIAEKLAYVQDEHLTELYIKLLTTASVSDSVQHAHPSFVNIINNLSPDEAILLEIFINQRSLPYLSARNIFPDSAFQMIVPCILEDRHLVKLKFPQNIGAYLNNLSCLGLVKILDDSWLKDGTRSL